MSHKRSQKSRHEWGWLRNFFCPVMKYLRTKVTGRRNNARPAFAQTPGEQDSPTFQVTVPLVREAT